MAHALQDGFPVSYRHSREHLIAQAQALVPRQTLLLDSRSIARRGPEGETLAIDCCLFGARRPRQALVVSSGMHGVEGFAGAAIQHRLLAEQLPRWHLAPDMAVLVIHAINPYGFAWLRRVNEDNVDLNRNFVQQFEARANPAYETLYDALNPADLEPTHEAVRWRTIDAWIASHGLRAFQTVVAEGQYRFAQGLQFGGTAPAQSSILLRELIATYLSDTDRLAWIDLHTGLGAAGSYQLMSAANAGSERLAYTREIFGEGVVALDSGATVSPPLTGMLELEVAAGRPPASQLAFVTPEFGTHRLERVIRAIRADNWLHAHGRPEDLSERSTRAIKAELIESFRPDDANWRRQVLDSGISLITQAAERLPGIRII